MNPGYSYDWRWTVHARSFRYSWTGRLWQTQTTFVSTDRRLFDLLLSCSTSIIRKCSRKSIIFQNMRKYFQECSFFHFHKITQHSAGVLGTIDWIVGNNNRRKRGIHSIHIRQKENQWKGIIKNFNALLQLQPSAAPNSCGHGVTAKRGSKMMCLIFRFFCLWPGS